MSLIGGRRPLIGGRRPLIGDRRPLIRGRRPPKCVLSRQNGVSKVLKWAAKKEYHFWPLIGAEGPS